MAIPDRLLRKVERSGDCWLWRGYVVPGRDRVAFANIRETLRSTDKPDRAPVRYRSFKPEPRANLNGRSLPAARVVMSFALGVEYSRVPPLYSACHNDICVNPQHFTTKQGLRCYDPDVQPEDVLARLVQASPMPELGVENAALELGEHIPPEVWAQYLELPQ